MAEPGESLIPGDEAADERVDAAEASALAEAEEQTEDDDLLPLGMSWVFDFEARRFVQGGQGPLRAYGEDALIQWCLMAVNSTRFTHDVFSEAFGIESLDDLIGSVMAPELAAEFESRAREALMVHDRIVDVEDFAVTYDGASDTLHIDTFTVVTDDEERVAVNETTLPMQAVA